MTQVTKEYIAKLDSKMRITVREASYEYYQIYEYNDGTIVLKPRVLVEPDSISKNTLKMLDSSMKNMKEGKVSKKINIDKYLNLIDD